MPDLIPEPLTKELDIAGRKIPLYVPVVGAGIAVLLLVVVKLRGGGGGATAVSPSEAAQGGGAEAALGQFESALGELRGQVEAGQGSLAEQIAGLQGTFAEQISGLQAQLTGATAEQQAALQAQGALFQTGLEQQSQALQAGLAGVQTQAEQFKSDILARQDAVENRVLRLETQGTKINKADRGALASAFATLTRFTNEARIAAGTTPIPPFSISGETGNIQFDNGTYLLKWSGA
jgi:hypothetical protein